MTKIIRKDTTGKASTRLHPIATVSEKTRGQVSVSSPTANWREAHLEMIILSVANIRI